MVTCIIQAEEPSDCQETNLTPCIYVKWTTHVHLIYMAENNGVSTQQVGLEIELNELN